MIPPNPILAKHDIHIWRTDGANWPDVSALAAILTEEERTRAARFIFVEDTHQYVLGRGLLRLLLDGYLDRSPHNLESTANNYGKSSIFDQPSQQFNLSHSGDKVG